MRPGWRFAAIVLALICCASLATPALSADEPTVGTDALVGRIEVIPIATSTLTDQEFLTGAAGKPTTIAGILRVPTTSAGRLPAVILVHGSGGIGGNVDLWSQELNRMGVATFVIDDFTARGITSTVNDQTQMSRLTAIVDAYRALDVLAARPWIDPNRIALMGFSRGANISIYAAMRRFQKSYGTPGHDFAAFIGMYTPCTTRYIDDTNVSNKPIRLFHGTPDDWNPVAACRSYVTRLRRAGADVQLVEYPGANHAFDNPLTPPAISPRAQTTRHCEIVESVPGQLTDGRTNAPFSYQDPCVELGTHYGYDASATAASLVAVKAFLRTTFAMAGT